MDHLCPVCNGLTSLEQACAHCKNRLEDAGRLYDRYGSYSPYREIDDAKMDNGYPDRQQHQCLHTGWCAQCGLEQTVIVQEWTPDMLDAQKDAFR
ncbi:hypothetical protein [Brevibacillus choshinensis]|uniref:Uncharacterized protein n=1 Tax=Brevibacillus choshinensis TaxID=54911 RepID=A0ABX7FKR5_BRECH|nr:hypothetical protein [Brevibacillus choshinensis]QRG66828.1 hypothetical protein JNE38_25650 [Brevibacillus choshinensis]